MIPCSASILARSAWASCSIKSLLFLSARNLCNMSLEFMVAPPKSIEIMCFQVKMSESQTIQWKYALCQTYKDLCDAQVDIENQLFEQRKQTPYNLPYIKTLHCELQHIQINRMHIKDRLDKLDGFFK